jgi:hypothetical protein
VQDNATARHGRRGRVICGEGSQLRWHQPSSGDPTESACVAIILRIRGLVVESAKQTSIIVQTVREAAKGYVPSLPGSGCESHDPSTHKQSPS